MIDQEHEVIQEVVRQTRVVSPKVETGSPQHAYDTKKAIFRSYQFIWYMLGVIEVLLGFRMCLKLLGANTYSGFTNFIYSASGFFANPFVGILQSSNSSNSIFEWSTFIAMIVYAILAYGIVALFQLVKPTNISEVERSVDNQ